MPVFTEIGEPLEDINDSPSFRVRKNGVAGNGAGADVPSDSVPLYSLWLVIDIVDKRVDLRELCLRSAETAAAGTAEAGAAPKLFSSVVTTFEATDAMDCRVDRRVLCLLDAAAGAVAFCFLAADFVPIFGSALVVLVRLVNGFRFLAL